MTVPHEEPYDGAKTDDDRGRGSDALRCYAVRMLEQDPGEWPQLLFMIGDQVYADEVSPETLEFIRARRNTEEPPWEQVADFEEYTRLYREAWSEPIVRWLLANVGTAMLFDDHDVHDDWNISIDWLEEMRSQPWWHDRITGALVAYWVYQHLGNLSPKILAEMDLLREAAAPRRRLAAALRVGRGGRPRQPGPALELLADDRPQALRLHGLARGPRARTSSRAGCSTRTNGTGSTSASSGTSTTLSSPTPCP